MGRCENDKRKTWTCIWDGETHRGAHIISGEDSRFKEKCLEQLSRNPQMSKNAFNQETNKQKDLK